MGKVAYTLKGAAEALSVDKSAIVIAIQNGELTGRRINGTIIILRCDLKRWAKTLPDYLRTMG